MRLAFRHLTVDQLHVLSLTFTEVVTTYPTFRFEFGFLTRNFKRFPTTCQQPFGLGRSPIRQVIDSLSLSWGVVRFLRFPFPTRGLSLPCGFATDVMGSRLQTLLGLLRFTSKRCDRVWVPPILREGFLASNLFCLRKRDLVVEMRASTTFFHHSTFATRVEPELTEPLQRFTCVNPSYLPLAPCVLIGLEPL